MKILILGTRGIPNNYGGFEQFAGYLAKGLIELSNDVFVYNSHNHPYKKNKWQKINIIHIFDPEYKIGTIGQFIYDFLCILDSRKRNADVIIQLGYTSSSIWWWLLPKKTILLTNMDGLEWKRNKYKPIVKIFLKWAESLAIKHGGKLISDSIGIKNYINESYSVKSNYIAYGAEIFKNENENVLIDFEIEKYNYDLIIARLEPENNIEIILKGYYKSKVNRKIIVIGNNETKYGKYLKNKFNSNKNIVFLGTIYDQSILNNLRYFSNLYFHGHTVGGTNPSLLEAMSSKSLICAHHNEFNKNILGKDAYYFSNKDDITLLIHNIVKNKLEFVKINNNLQKIKEIYNYANIVEKYWDLINH